MKTMETRKSELQIQVLDAQRETIPYELVQSILTRFGEVYSKCNDNDKKKALLQMIIKEITIDKARNIDSIKLQLINNLMRFLKGEGVSNKDAPSLFVKKIKGYSMVEIEFGI